REAKLANPEPQLFVHYICMITCPLGGVNRPRSVACVGLVLSCRRSLLCFASHGNRRDHTAAAKPPTRGVGAGVLHPAVGIDVCCSQKFVGSLVGLCFSRTAFHASRNLHGGISSAGVSRAAAGRDFCWRAAWLFHVLWVRVSNCRAALYNSV